MKGHTEPAAAPLKVIIVGAGVGGLTLAHSLDKAGFDYVVLDKHPVAPAWGASITVHTQGCRILHQLGILEAVEKQCTEMRNFWNRGPDGKNFLVQPFFHFVNRRTGYLTLTLERRTFIRTLYEQLPNKSKVIEGARIADIIEQDNQVKAVLVDGTEHIGDMIVGCDGVHSGVRDIMWQKAHALSPGLITVQEKHSIKTAYNALVGVAPYQPGLGTQDMTCVSNDRFSFLFLTQPDAIYFIVHCKLPNNQVVKYPNRLRYTQADADAKAAELADYPVSDTLVFGDVWKTRTRGQLVSLEEGILTHWSFGRTVLVGDACHKVTPNAALGGSMAMEGAVRLANELYALVQRHPNKKPSDTEVQMAFQNYRDAQKSRVQELSNISWILTRMQAFDGWLMYFLQRWVLPTLGLDFLGSQVAKASVKAPKLSYVPFQEESGSVPWEKHAWENENEIAKKAPTTNPGDYNRLIVPVVVTTLAVYLTALWMFGGGGSGARSVMNTTTSVVDSRVGYN